MRSEVATTAEGPDSLFHNSSRHCLFNSTVWNMVGFILCLLFTLYASFSLHISKISAVGWGFCCLPGWRGSCGWCHAVVFTLRGGLWTRMPQGHILLFSKLHLPFLSSFTQKNFKKLAHSTVLDSVKIFHLWSFCFIASSSWKKSEVVNERVPKPSFKGSRLTTACQHWQGMCQIIYSHLCFFSPLLIS